MPPATPTRRTVLAGLAASLAVAGCAAPVASRKRPPTPLEISRLAAAIRALGPGVDAEEAERAARVAYVHTAELAEAYQITDPPLVHNAKVNRGLRPRGLCWHWAEDMEKRLKAERFRTLDLHRAIANADNPVRIEHSTAIISARGAPMQEGIVLDPWRRGGILTWVPVREDRRYRWHPRMQVLRETGRVIERSPSSLGLSQASPPSAG